MIIDTALHEDPGLQPERTTQAWQRTSFALAVAGAIALRWAAQLGLGATVLAVVTLSVAAGAVLLAWQSKHYRRAAGAIRGGRGAADPWSILLLTLAVCALAIVAIALVW